MIYMMTHTSSANEPNDENTSSANELNDDT